jgi:hypothetical protein
MLLRQQSQVITDLQYDAFMQTDSLVVIGIL